MYVNKHKADYKPKAEQIALVTLVKKSHKTSFMYFIFSTLNEELHNVSKTTFLGNPKMQYFSKVNTRYE